MTPEKDREQAGYLLNRLLKRDRHLRKWARREGHDCYRVYDRDIPEIPLAIDRYGDAAVVFLYQRPYEKDPADEAAWLALMTEATSAALSIEPGAVYAKTRKRLGIDDQYGRAADYGSTRIVTEYGLRFEVNLSDYLDTGLFMDHRPTRALVGSMARGARVLNLFCYTGSFSVYALAGGATEVTGVDLSNTYLAWAARNVELNALDEGRYRGERADALEYIERTAGTDRRWDLIVLDPPTFSNSKAMAGFLDVNRHWPRLVERCAGLLTPGGTLVFSTNSRELRFDEALLPGLSVRDISAETVPEDYGGRPHRAWLIRTA